MAGKYIINQTAGKRYIILEEDNEKIEGGYFDTEGEWHDLSGPLEGDLIGKYVINETGGKRIIILEEDADEIGGGYFDTDGTWIDFGESDVIVVDVSKFQIGSNSGSNLEHYFVSTNTSRLSYQYFDIFLEGGYKYTFEVESTNSAANIGFQFFTQAVYDKYMNNTTFQNTEIYDPGWQGLAGELSVPASVNGSPVIGARFTSRGGTNNPVITENFITSFVLTKGDPL